MTWLQENAGAVQAIATIVLVAITAWYATVTRALSREARRQADATREGLERAFQEGIRQQEQLVQRQALLDARSELSALLAKSIHLLADSSRLAKPLSDTEGAKTHESITSDSLKKWLERYRQNRESADALDLTYLEQYCGAYPLSVKLIAELILERIYLDGDLSRLAAVLERIHDAGVEDPDLKPARFLAASACARADNLLTNLVDVRAAVQRTGYSRAFGHIPLDSADIGSELSRLIVVDGEWCLNPSDEARVPMGYIPAE